MLLYLGQSGRIRSLKLGEKVRLNLKHCLKLGFNRRKAFEYECLVFNYVADVVFDVHVG